MVDGWELDFTQVEIVVEVGVELGNYFVVFAHNSERPLISLEPRKGSVFIISPLSPVL